MDQTLELYLVIECKKLRTVQFLFLMSYRPDSNTETEKPFVVGEISDYHQNNKGNCVLLRWSSEEGGTEKTRGPRIGPCGTPEIFYPGL